MKLRILTQRRIGSLRNAGLLLAGLLALEARGAIAVSPDEMELKNQWVHQNLLTSGTNPPFSFSYGGQASTRLLSEWKRTGIEKTLDANRTQHEFTWTDGALLVRCVAVEYKDYPVVEWTVYFKNVGTASTPILDGIQGLDTKLSRGSGPEFILNGNKGDFSAKDSYEPYEVTLGPSTENDFSPAHIGKDSDSSGTGKSCDGPKGWPYYNLQVPGGGIILAIGWPGQWASSFIRDDAGGLTIKAGQELTHLYLMPGEEIRTPLIAMLFWQGTDRVRSQNIWRRWYRADNEPRINGEPQPVTAEGPGDCISKLSKMLAAGIRLDNCWHDAEGDGGTWWPSETGPYHVARAGESVPPLQKEASAWWNTGTWDVDPAKYPEGFRPFSDWARAHGLTFMLWFEPERVGNPNSWLGKNHPEWLLPANSLTYGIHPSFDPILDEGNPNALNWLINHVDSLIDSQGIDIYREDMNGAGPCGAWRKNDAKDRQGITENRYVQGHLAFWDELRRRHPRLRIDSCASGGRRNDLESMRRGVSIGNRSDFMLDLPDVVEGNQGQTYGLSSWLPLQGSYSPYHDIYSYRSFYLTSFGVDADVEIQKKAYGDWREIAPYMLGDYYPLTAYSLQPDQWIAWQFDRPEIGGGEVQAFRRAQCKDDSISLKLQGLDSGATYEVRNLDGGKETHSGSELMGTGLVLKTTAAPAALVLTYTRLK